ncbi:aminotransferase class IV [Pollutimonas thiosulfatoxidans]|uniref:Aminotransferase n=1 Tax=Pollutimonas thiosulfatoxidans TaxID=2028345 RepID=A0A410G8E6_9BURK|nr:aminotransferase class IV [Pollutimonas thiosulfatoxidans]QAA92598.1 hypothetical protein CKA81_01135 [Pollutimonas thiosulfatoxidans]
MTPDAVQLIETLRVDPGGAMPLLAGHRERLRASCQALGFRWPADLFGQHLPQLASTLDRNTGHRVRVLVSPDGSYDVRSGPLAATPQPVSVRLATTPLLANPFWLRHKSTHRPWYRAAQAWLEAQGTVFDVIYCNAEHQLCEGSRSNIYVQDGAGQWLTPALSCGLLPGVQRQALLEQGLVREATLTKVDLISSPALRVSNALRGWLDARLSSSEDFPHERPASISH